MSQQLEVDVTYAARRPWVPRRGHFQAWAAAVLTSFKARESPLRRADSRRPAVRGAGTDLRRADRRGVRKLKGGRNALSVRVVGAARSRSLNARYRTLDKATNVLSFSGAGLGADGRYYLGELVICAPVVAREARAQGKSAAAHWAHMTVHGVLHLLGFDHERGAEARRMAAREVQILDCLGFADPYV
jgi:probable rRNA maturation factor